VRVRPDRLGERVTPNRALFFGGFLQALARNPLPAERAASLEILGSTPSAQNIEDLLWTVCMLPEFQLIR
jgi:hypothetical protein